MDKKTLLVVLAHPDDESFGTGGTLALYAQRGVEVHLVCATRGEAGTLDEDCLDGFDSIADRRVSELRCASGALGLTGIYFLGYRDSGMPGSADNANPQALINAPTEIVAGQIVTYIRSLHPQVVITFDPIGGYKHPDHIAIHKATVMAFEQAGKVSYHDPEDLPPYQPQKLYFHLFPKGMLRWGVRFMRLIGRDPRHFGRNGDIDLVDLVDSGEFPVHASVDYRAVQDQKNAASACHESQLGGAPPRNRLMGRLMGMFDGRDYYMRAYPAVNGKVKVKERDLFEGV
jgi:N-acetyl-1-D-myo-inositol-2-amino-2-deoxy-alpha-D-glucopyranoside deacetylase